MAVKFFSKKSLETKTSAILKSQSLEPVAMVIAINVVTGGIRREDLK